MNRFKVSLKVLISRTKTNTHNQITQESAFMSSHYLHGSFYVPKIRNLEFMFGFGEQVFKVPLKLLNFWTKVSLKLLNFWTNSRTSWLPKNLHSCQVIIFIWFLLHQLESRCFSLSHDAVRPVEHKRLGFFNYRVVLSLGGFKVRERFFVLFGYKPHTDETSGNHNFFTTVCAPV